MRTFWGWRVWAGFEEPHVGEEKQGEDGGGGFGEQGEREWKEVECGAAQFWVASVEEQGSDAAEGAVEVAALDDVVDGFGHGRVEAEEGGGEESDPAVVRGRLRSIEQGAEEGVQQEDEGEEEEEGEEVEVDGNVVVAEGVIEGEGGGDDGAVGAVGGEDAEGGGVGEEVGNVREAADGGVVDDGVEVVEVEAVVEGVGVGEAKREKQGKARRPDGG
jgi:hypothetical protein